MGHANYRNISTRVNRRLHRRGSASIRECVDALEKAGEGVHASEGLCPERHMIAMAVEEIFGILSQRGEIGPLQLSPKQRKVLGQWKRGETDDWDAGEEGNGGEYGTLDTIRWQPLKKRLTVVGHVSH